MPMSLKRFHILRRLVELLLLSTLVAVGVALVNPLPGEHPRVTLAELRDEPSFSEILWVDARSAEEFNRGHFPGAISVNQEDWEAGLSRFMMKWEPGDMVVVYCDDRSCGSSVAVAERLSRELEIQGILILDDGWAELVSEKDLR